MVAQDLWYISDGSHKWYVGEERQCEARAKLVRVRPREANILGGNATTVVTFFPLGAPLNSLPRLGLLFPMKWGIYWPELLIGTLVLAINGVRWFHPTDASNPIKSSSAWTPQRRHAARLVKSEDMYMGTDILSQRENSRALVSWFWQLHDVWCVIYPAFKLRWYILSVCLLAFPLDEVTASCLSFDTLLSSSSTYIAHSPILFRTGPRLEKSVSCVVDITRCTTLIHSQGLI